MRKSIFNLTFQSEYFSEAKKNELKGQMILPKHVTIRFECKGFATPIGRGIPFGVVYFELQHYDLNDYGVDIERADTLKDLLKTIKAWQRFYGYTDEWSEEITASVLEALPKVNKKLHFLNKKGVYIGLEDLNEVQKKNTSLVEK